MDDDYKKKIRDLVYSLLCHNANRNMVMANGIDMIRNPDNDGFAVMFDSGDTIYIRFENIKEETCLEDFHE